MLAEHMDESLILIRQTICWRTRDFVFVNEDLWKTAQLPESVKQDKKLFSAIAALITIDMVCERLTREHASADDLAFDALCCVDKFITCCCALSVPTDLVQALYGEIEAWFWQMADQRPAWDDELQLFKETRPKVVPLRMHAACHDRSICFASCSRLRLTATPTACVYPGPCGVSC